MLLHAQDARQIAVKLRKIRIRHHRFDFAVLERKQLRIEERACRADLGSQRTSAVVHRLILGVRAVLIGAHHRVGIKTGELFVHTRQRLERIQNNFPALRKRAGALGKRLGFLADFFKRFFPRFIRRIDIGSNPKYNAGQPSHGSIPFPYSNTFLIIFHYLNSSSSGAERECVRLGQ